MCQGIFANKGSPWPAWPKLKLCHCSQWKCSFMFQPYVKSDLPLKVGFLRFWRDVHDQSSTIHHPQGSPTLVGAMALKHHSLWMNVLLTDVSLEISAAKQAANLQPKRWCWAPSRWASFASLAWRWETPRHGIMFSLCDGHYFWGFGVAWYLRVSETRMMYVSIWDLVLSIFKMAKDPWFISQDILVVAAPNCEIEHIENCQDRYRLPGCIIQFN